MGNCRSFKQSKDFGFTLAEVLITLGIIGVVAALTMPALISKYQMKVFETAFKKQYSVLQNSINYASLINGYTQCYMKKTPGEGSYSTMTDDCNALYDDIISQMKLTPINTDIKNSYARKANIMANGGKTINAGCSYDYYISVAKTYMSPDGSLIMYTYDPSVTPIIIDVNGKKGPNKWGYDVFFLTLSNHNEKTNKILLTDEFCSIVEKGGRFPRMILRKEDINNIQGTASDWFWK